LQEGLNLTKSFDRKLNQSPKQPEWECDHEPQAFQESPHGFYSAGLFLGVSMRGSVFDEPVVFGMTPGGVSVDNTGPIDS